MTALLLVGIILLVEFCDVGLAQAVPTTVTVEVVLNFTQHNSTNVVCAENGTVARPFYSCTADQAKPQLTAMFVDPAPRGLQVSAVNFTLTGRFNCMNDTTAENIPVFLMNLNGATLLYEQLPEIPAGCGGNSGNCMATTGLFSSITGEMGWQGQEYEYGTWNEVQIIMIANEICLSSINMLLICQPPTIALTNITPAYGPVTGGTPINITATGFTLTLWECVFDPDLPDSTAVPGQLNLAEGVLSCVTPAASAAKNVSVMIRSADSEYFACCLEFTYIADSDSPSGPSPGSKAWLDEMVTTYWWVLLIGSVCIVLSIGACVAILRPKRSPQDRFSSSGGEKEHLLPRGKGYDSFRIRDEIDISEIQLLERIGRGNFGEVFKGLWRGTVVAVKKTKLPTHGSPEEVEQWLKDFEMEASIMRTLRHPNVLQFLGVGSDKNEKSGDICIITEFMPRGSLFGILHRKSFDLSWSLIIRIAMDVARGMNYLHKCTPVIIHRDLKSHNLLVDETFKVKVCDFGLARLLGQQNEKELTSCGTPSWTAPEVLRNEHYTESADIYSYGVVLWELVTRSEPHQGMPPFQVVFAVGTQGLRPTIPDSCPTEFRQLIEDCWSEIPYDRPKFDQIMKRLEDMLKMVHQTRTIQ